MKLLLDHSVPQRLARAFVGHEVSTVADAGWDRLRNGILLAAAAAGGYDALVTVERNIRYEQDLTKLPIAVVVIRTMSNDLGTLLGLMPHVLDAINDLQPRQLIEVPAE